MDEPALYLTSKTPDPAYPPVVEKVISLIERFIGKYGSVQLEVFRLPTFSSAELQRYLNSLSITLKRHGIIVSYTWQYHPSESAYYLFLFHTASITGSISGIVYRLWHTSPSITQLDNIPVSAYNLGDIKNGFSGHCCPWARHSLLHSLLITGIPTALLIRFDLPHPFPAIIQGNGWGLCWAWAKTSEVFAFEDVEIIVFLLFTIELFFLSAILPVER